MLQQAGSQTSRDASYQTSNHTNLCLCLFDAAGSATGWRHSNPADTKNFLKSVQSTILEQLNKENESQVMGLPERTMAAELSVSLTDMPNVVLHQVLLFESAHTLGTVEAVATTLGQVVRAVVVELAATRTASRWSPCRGAHAVCFP